MKEGMIKSEDGKIRCWWPGNHKDYITYHDQEWGHPTKDDTQLFEKICLEGFQSGLSWLTILRKRENFRKAFKGFDIEKVARFSDTKVESLVKDAGIIRHRGKIKSTINNAQRAVELINEKGSLAKYFWDFEPSPKERPKKMDYQTLSKIALTPKSTALSKDLKKRGWSFVGPTTAYAFMQAMGLVNDHLEGCFYRNIVEEKRKKFKRP